MDRTVLFVCSSAMEIQCNLIPSFVCLLVVYWVWQSIHYCWQDFRYREISWYFYQAYGVRTNLFYHHGHSSAAFLLNLHCESHTHTHTHKVLIITVTDSKMFIITSYSLRCQDNLCHSLFCHFVRAGGGRHCFPQWLWVQCWYDIIMLSTTECYEVTKGLETPVPREPMGRAICQTSARVIT